MVRRLLIGISDLDQRRLAPRASDDLQAGRQVLAGIAHRHDQRRPMQAGRDPAGRACRRRVAVAVELGRVAGRRHDRALALKPKGNRAADIMTDKRIALVISVLHLMIGLRSSR